MFPAFGGERWWPLTAQLVILRSPVDAVVRKMTAFDGTADRWQSAADLDALLREAAPLLANWDGERVYVGTGDDSTVVLDTAGGDLLQWMSIRAEKELRCAMVAASFRPPAANVYPSASFVVQRAPGRFRGLDRERDFRHVGMFRDDSRWVWDARGAQQDYEDPAHYGASRVGDRVPLELIGQYLAAEGVPIDDSGYLTGPAWIGRRRTPRHSVETWSTIAGLRARQGYSESGVPTSLYRR